jgi:hypothetical protein
LWNWFIALDLRLSWRSLCRVRSCGLYLSVVQCGRRSGGEHIARRSTVCQTWIQLNHAAILAKLSAYYCWFPAWVTLRPWRWKRYVPPKHRGISPVFTEL